MDTFVAVVVVVAVAAGLFVRYVARRPDEFRIARTAHIAAPAERVVALINDLRAMNAWNPFDKKKDPNIKGTYSGPPSGVGAHYDFEGKKAGTGFVEIIESTAPRHVVMRLHMTRPMSADHRVDFTVEPQGLECDVTWALSGKSQFMGKLCGLVMNMDEMCGRVFEDGLSDLRALAEQGRNAA